MSNQTSTGFIDGVFSNEEEIANREKVNEQQIFIDAIDFVFSILWTTIQILIV